MSIYIRYFSALFLFLFPFLSDAQQFYLTQYSQALPWYNPSFTGIESFSAVDLGIRDNGGGDVNTPTTMQVNINLALTGENKKYGQETKTVKRPNITFRTSDQTLFSRHDTKVETEVHGGGLRKRQEVFEARSKHGLGAGLVSIKAGGIVQYQGQLSYAFHLPLSKRWKASFGAAALVSSSRYNVIDYTMRNSNDQIYLELLDKGGRQELFYYLNMGGTLYSQRYHLSYAYTNVLGGNLENTANDSSAISNKMEDVHGIMAGMRISLGGRSELQPNVLLLLRTNTPSLISPGVKWIYDQKFMAGVNYRPNESVDFITAVMLSPQIKFGYSFDLLIGDPNNTDFRMHELSLSFILNRDNKTFDRRFW
ncbi:PorP/SprF family type IX secretion system membrane protein [Algivirga pacifica]|uniref:Type IX secretion system membrane protein, PorP/SprF family n=1 Tax=Algivirga pacifica TaxID=1162670 RepID=A0ABP9DKN9_9BACT